MIHFGCFSEISLKPTLRRST